MLTNLLTNAPTIGCGPRRRAFSIFLPVAAATVRVLARPGRVPAKDGRRARLRPHSNTDLPPPRKFGDNGNQVCGNEVQADGELNYGH